MQDHLKKPLRASVLPVHQKERPGKLLPALQKEQRTGYGFEGRIAEFVNSVEETEKKL